MRPIAEQRSATRYPLDIILGSEAHVRLLRTLIHETDASLSVPEAAKLAGLTPAGTRRALERLVESGIIERTGGGRSPRYGLRQQTLVVQALGQLFAREQERYDSLISALQGVLSDLTEIREAWFDELPRSAAGPLEINVVSETRAISWIGEDLRSRLVKLEKQFDLILEVAVYTRADAPTPGSDAVFLRSMTALPSHSTQRQALSHAQTEERSLLAARKIADLIRSNPSLVRRAKHHLDLLMHDSQGPAIGDIAEWRQLLETYSVQRLRTLLVSRNSRATRLRQSSPFYAVLTAEERNQLIASLEIHHDPGPA